VADVSSSSCVSPISFSVDFLDLVADEIGVCSAEIYLVLAPAGPFLDRFLYRFLAATPTKENQFLAAAPARAVAPQART
jgi:hypothetical protein